MRDMWRLFRFVLQPSPDVPRSRGAMLLIVLAGIVSGAASTLLLALINRVITNRMDLGVLLAFLGLCVLLPATRFGSQVLLIHVSQRSMLDLRMRLVRQVLSTPLRKLEEIGPGRVLANLTEDVANVREISRLIPLLTMHIAVLIGCLIYLAWLSWILVVVVVGFSAFGVLVYATAVRRASSYFRLMRDGTDAIMHLFRGLTDGAKELRLHRERRGAFASRILDTASSIMENGTSANRTYAVASSWGLTLPFAAIGLLLGLHLLGDAFTLEVLSGGILVILYARTPLDVLLQMLPTFNRAGISLDKIQRLGMSLGASPALPASGSENPLADPVWDRLELRGVTHTYHHETEDRPFVVGPVDLTLRRGELVFLVGGNGSGKTTLAKVVLGLYPPESGEIVLDGRRITESTRDDYSQLFSAVFSDFHLFEFLLGMEDRPDLDEQARHYLTLLALDHKVEVRDGALSTVELSQGQRKRLALLTAYLEDRSIYLFDEWAADQDPSFKDVFYLELLPALRAWGKTIVAISHDDRYYDQADRIVKLENGQVVYDGPADEYQVGLVAEPLAGPLGAGA